MAKLSGFFMSTLLIVLCLWINVCHYPDATRTATANVEGGASREEIVSPPASSVPAPVDAPASDLTPLPAPAPPNVPTPVPTNEQDPIRQSGLFAETESAPVPELLDVSASQPALVSPKKLDAPSPTPPVLSPASFPVDDSSRPQRPVAPRPPVLSEKISNDAGTDAGARSLAPLPASQTAAPAVATPTQEVRRSATKPRGAKYVRVPDVEIDAFSGGVRNARSSNDETRVVGATRAKRTLNVAAPASSAP